MPEPSPSPQESLSCSCPACGQVLVISAHEQNLLQCANCGEQFFIGSMAEPDGGQSDESPASPAVEAELSELRIRHVMHERQAMYRSRRWPIMWGAAALMTAAKLIQIAVVAFRHGRQFIVAADTLAALLALILASHFARDVLRITRHIRSTRQAEPSSPPDFSSLSDGSQHWENLERMTGERGDE